MSYYDAKKNFADNRRVFGLPIPDDLHSQVLFNLNNGLENMMDGIHSDLAQIQTTLNAIAQSLKRNK